MGACLDILENTAMRSKRHLIVQSPPRYWSQCRDLTAQTLGQPMQSRIAVEATEHLSKQLAPGGGRNTIRPRRSELSCFFPTH